MISVIIPIYNVEQYLMECLDSVKKQTFCDWECICVDDGSTDNSGKICDQYAEKDSRFHVIHERNGGVSAARNAGIRKAQGDFVFFLDSDDCLHTKTLEFLCTLQRETNADIVISGYKEFVKDPSFPFFDGPEALKQYDRSDNPFTDFCTDRMRISSFVWGKLYHVKSLGKIFFDAALRIHEEAIYNIRSLFQAKCVVATNFPLYCYRQNPDSLTGKGQYLLQLKYLHQTLSAMKKFILEHKIPEEYVEPLMKMAGNNFFICLCKSVLIQSIELKDHSEYAAAKVVFDQAVRDDLVNLRLALRYSCRITFFVFIGFSCGFWPVGYLGLIRKYVQCAGEQ